MDANDLVLFARVVDSGSFSRAAERLQLPKSTVSRRVAALESRLGEKLLQRSTRRLALTEFGQGVLDHARGVAAEVDNALTLALHRQSKPSGRLRVSMPADFAHQALGDMLTQFALDHPNVQLELDLSPRRVDLIGEGFDIAVRMGELSADSSLAARLLARVGSALYASPDYLRRQGEPQLPSALLDMHGLLILSRSGDPIPWELQRGEERWRGTPLQRTLVNAPDMLLRMARAGVGIVAVNQHFAREPLARGELVQVLPEWSLPPTPCWAVFPERKLMPLRSRVFIDAMAAALTSCGSGG
jgi:DNA-binding transcriptional LysR family regulator